MLPHCKRRGLRRKRAKWLLNRKVQACMPDLPSLVRSHRPLRNLLRQQRRSFTDVKRWPNGLLILMCGRTRRPVGGALLRMITSILHLLLDQLRVVTGVCLWNRKRRERLHLPSSGMRVRADSQRDR